MVICGYWQQNVYLPLHQLFIAIFVSMACTGESRQNLEEAKLGRDNEGTENRDTRSNMAWSWGGGMIAWSDWVLTVRLRFTTDSTCVDPWEKRICSCTVVTWHLYSLGCQRLKSRDQQRVTNCSRVDLQTNSHWLVVTNITSFDCVCCMSYVCVNGHMRVGSALSTPSTRYTVQDGW